MALKYYAGLFITGTHSDRTGGTWTNLPSGWRFLETDTQVLYHWTGSAWTITSGNRGYPTVRCYKIGSTYYAIRYDGVILSASSTAETVLQNAIAQKGVIQIEHIGGEGTGGQNTHWDLSGAASSPIFTLANDTYIRGASKNVFIRVPEDFVGTIFKVGGSGNDPDDSVGMENISIEEQGATPSQDWTGIKFEIVGTSLLLTSWKNIFIYGAKTGMELETTSSGFINDNLFENIAIYDPEIGILFDQQSGEISCNEFNSITVEANGAAACTNGIKDINGDSNLFINCKMMDFNTANMEANIKSTAEGTIIVGGRMCGSGLKGGAGGHFIDDGIATVIVGGNRFTGFTGRSTSYLVTPDVAKTGAWYGPNIASGDGILNGRLSQVTVGTATASLASDSSGIYYSHDTGATINSLSGQRCTVATMRRILNAYFKAKIRTDSSIANVRIFAGLVGSTSAPASAADPLNATAGVALWYDSAVNANWRRLHNDTSGASVSDDTTLAVGTSTEYTVEIYAHGDNKFRFVFNGTSTDITTDIPASTTGLAYWVYIENTTGASRIVRHYFTTVRNDK